MTTGSALSSYRSHRAGNPRPQRARHVLRILSELLSFEPAGTGTHLAAALEHLEAVLRRRSVLFIVSDFLTSGYEAALADWPGSTTWSESSWSTPANVSCLMPD